MCVLSRISFILFMMFQCCRISAAENLIRNGSFEGGMLYWHDQRGKEIVEGGKVGQYAFQINNGWSLSAPIPMERDAEYTISLWARSVEGESWIAIGMPPMGCEAAKNSGRIWAKGATKGFSLTTEWKRISVTFKADVKRYRVWTLPNYGVYLGGSKKRPAIQVDGVTVVKGTTGTEEYIPRADIEVLADPTNLPGYRGAAGNMYKKGATATLDGYVHNPTDSERNITVRWQLMDYEGVMPHADPQDIKIALKPGATAKVPVSMPLTATGTVLARLTALDEKGERIDSSDIPLCSLPYEKAATTPNYDERFGGSFAGGVECLERMQRIGFGWTRWWANNKWHAYEPEEGKFDWSMDKQEEAWSRGISNHVVLYGWPKWIMDKNHPLPRDMRWKADDPRWEDLTVETSWDRFVKAAVEAFRGKPVVLQIANEPGHDKWKNGWKAEYVKFNIRTARLIKQLDPEAKVSINNVYTNPSSVNSGMLKSKQMQDMDIWSWHDYRSGWIGDVQKMKRIQQMLNDAGGGHMEVWLTEGWAFTNTLVDQPIACTSLSSVESTHAIMNSVTEMTAVGHDKFVMFHLQYGQHGMSYWDYSGPGNMIWDWYSYPTALVGGWNTLIHHIGLSDQIGLVRPSGVNFAVFTDNRNQRGVMVAYADKNAKEDVTIDLPIAGLTAEDIQGNPVKWDGKSLTLSKTGRPVILYTASGSGQPLYDALEPLDRKHLGFVSKGEDGKQVFSLPEAWQGEERGTAKGNPALNGEEPMWRVDRLYPSDSKMPGNYEPMVWNGTRWTAKDRSQGGHPSAELKNGVLLMGTLGPWGGNTQNFRKQGALAFVVPESGLYHIQLTANSRPWGGSKADVHLSVMKKDAQRVGEIEKFTLKANRTPVKIDLKVDAAKGHELLLLTTMYNYNNSTTVKIRDLKITKE